jgi:hypothetical protein
MRKILIISFMMVLFAGSSAWAALYSGSIGKTYGGATPTGNVWTSNGNLAWTVDKDGDDWVYTYIFTGGTTKDIKTFDLQVASDFNLTDLQWTPLAGYPSSITGPSAVQTTITENILTKDLTLSNGLQWTFDGTKDYSLGLQIKTTRAPMWGDLIVHGAVAGSVDSSFCNADLGNTDDNPVLAPDGGVYNGVGVLVPKGPSAAPVPIPPAAFLFGSGLSGLFLYRRRKPAA